MKMRHEEISNVTFETRDDRRHAEASLRCQCVDDVEAGK